MLPPVVSEEHHPLNKDHNDRGAAGIANDGRHQDVQKLSADTDVRSEAPALSRRRRPDAERRRRGRVGVQFRLELHVSMFLRLRRPAAPTDGEMSGRREGALTETSPWQCAATNRS